MPVRSRAPLRWLEPTEAAAGWALARAQIAPVTADDTAQAQFGAVDAGLNRGGFGFGHAEAIDAVRAPLFDFTIDAGPGGPREAAEAVTAQDPGTGPISAEPIPGDGPDVISGGPTGETLFGLGGSDTITGGGGADVIYGFSVADTDANSGAIVAERIASGLSSPIFASSPPGDPTRFFVVEQHTGAIKIMDLNSGQVSATPFLDIPNGQLANGSEQGLLGMAFHPDYATNGKFYVYLTNAAGDIEVREYTRSAGNPNVANTTYKLVLTFDHPSDTNHNGGWIGFGPDGNLWIATGDGGGGGDIHNYAQNLDSYLGKLLRIDVNGDDFPADANRNYAIPDDNPFVGQAGLDEIWGYGLRNPWRVSFDPVTGDLYIADVGQGQREEINVVPAGTPGGINFGWHVMEGDLPYDTNTPGNPPANDPSLWDPVAVYSHDPVTGGFAVTGGYAYYGPGGAQGLYFFADYVTGNIWTIAVDENGQLLDYTDRNDQFQVTGGTLDQISSFAVDSQGRLYAIGLDGEIYRITPSTAAGDGGDTLSGGDGDDQIWGGAGADLLSGDNGNDRVNGGLGDDIITGGEGEDRLRGDAGQDQLFGGLGDDELRGSNGNDLIDGGDGADVADYENESSGPITVNLTLTGAQNTGAAGIDTLIGIEHVKGGQANDTITGNALNNTLWGNGGIDSLAGGDGNDTLIGGTGADALNGGAGLDYASYSTAGVGVTINLTTGVHLGDAAGDTFVGIERFRLSSFGDTFTGAGGEDTAYGFSDNDVLNGAGGADKLFGQQNNDTLNGDAGNDILIGELGADVINGGDGRDTASYEDALAAVTLNFTGADVGNSVGDTFNSIEVFWLSTFGDTFIGDALANEVRGYLGADTLNGGDGADRLRGEQDNDILNGDAGDDFLWGDAGADTLNGGIGTDTACYTYSLTGITLNLTTGVHTGEAAGDSFVSIERFQLSNQSTQADSFTGSAGNDWVAGYKGADTLFGMDGADTLNGGNQNDVLNGGAGSDKLIGELGNDSLTGGADADTFWFNVPAFGADTVTDFENGLDRIRITGQPGIDDISDLTITQAGVNVLITLPDGSTITLNNTTTGQIEATNFLWI